MEENKNIVEFLKPREREVIEDSYFENMVSVIVAGNPKKEPAKIIPLYQRKSFWISSAAAVAILFVAIRFMNQSGSINPDFDSLSHSELTAYIDHNIEDFDQELLAQYVHVETNAVQAKVESDQHLNSSVPNNELEKSVSRDDLFEGIDQKDILEYLNHQEMNVDDLEETDVLF